MNKIGCPQREGRRLACIVKAIVLCVMWLGGNFSPVYGLIQAGTVDPPLGGENDADRSGQQAKAKPKPSQSTPNGKDRVGVTDGTGDRSPIPDPLRVGGEPSGIVQIANLVYAGSKSSQCFSDQFLVKADQDSAISTSRRFHAVKLASDDLFANPMVIMTGEGDFTLSAAERENLQAYVERGGFLLASAGCSSAEWDRAFRLEMATIFSGRSLHAVGMDHPIFHTVYEIDQLQVAHGSPRPLEGVTFEGRLGVLYSRDGLNDTANAQGCCCCGGNEITNANQINVNALAYALIY